MPEEADYYRKRGLAEREAAEASADDRIKEIHLEMAQAYERLAQLRLESLMQGGADAWAARGVGEGTKS